MVEDDGALCRTIPDLILHHQGDNSANVVVAEFKKRGRSLKKDIARLSSFMNSAICPYQFGISIVLNPDSVRFRWLERGKSEMVDETIQM